MPFNIEVRFYSKYLFAFYDKQTKTRMGATNMKVLADKTGIKYGRIRYLFVDLRKDLYEDDKCIIFKIPSDMIFKGRRGAHLKKE